MGPMHDSRVVALLLALVLALGSGGCTSIRYYWQAMRGQFELVHEARPIEEVIADPATSQRLKDTLGQVQVMRDFASRELALPDNGSYRRYADLGRSYVVWNVFATEEFSTRAKEWCFPVAGCVGYRGYFKEADARAFAREQAQAGLDVYVGGVPAYSTLGWLDDPVLSTFVHYPPVELARLVFHELSHQVVYVKGDTTFNESFAMTVEIEGGQRWVRAHGTPQMQQGFEQAQARKRDFAELIERTRARLDALYGEAGTDPASLRRRKALLLEDMRAQYAALRQGWGDFAGYDWWFAQPLNNAQLASIALYTRLVPGFQQVLRENAGDMPAFYVEVERLAGLPEAQRAQRLSAPGAQD